MSSRYSDLVDAVSRDKLKWAMSEPERLRPGETRQMVTERAAAAFAGIAQSLRERGHHPETVAHFVNRLVFCMFAEDAGLLPGRMFTRMLERTQRDPSKFEDYASGLFGAMSTGGDVGFEAVAWFNGGLFDDEAALELGREEIEAALRAATLDWSEIDPSILGTLFERGLDPSKRTQLGAHYTDRDKIMRIVEPVIVRPLLTEWRAEKAKIADAMERAGEAKSPSARTRSQRQAERKLRRFLERLRTFIVLDPACGSGNFLYLALLALKDIEHRVQLEAEALGLQRSFPAVGPGNVRGIEINAYAAELSRVSVWIGEIQWMRRNGFRESRDPILKQLETIECRDAILASDGTEPEWPQADVVIGNPPFLGGKLLLEGLGDQYVERLRRVYDCTLPRFADLVCYWFQKSYKLVAEGKIDRAGLVATNSIRGGKNRMVLDRIVDHGVVFDAWSDEAWVIDGAAVRVSVISFAARNSDLPIHLNGLACDRIAADLTSGSADLTKVRKIILNRDAAFVGDQKSGPFDIAGDLAREWLRLPANPNGQPNADVLRPWLNGMDVVRRSTGKWIVDFGDTMTESEAAFYEAPFTYAREHVLPMRKRSKVKGIAEFWWRHWCPRPKMSRALDGLKRYIATPTVSKHRLFVWLDVRICPDHQLIVVAREDDTTFGILHSRFHEAWALRLGTSLEDRPRYTPTTTFETFPFPEGLSLNISAAEYASDRRAATIAGAARNLVELRERWLNPPEWVEWVDEPVSGYPKRPVARHAEAGKELKKRTLTNLYNARPQWLSDAHEALDSAVAAAYGWEYGISNEEALERLLALNLGEAR